MRYLDGSLAGAPGGVYSTGINAKLSHPTCQQWFDTCRLNTAGVRQNCATPDQKVAFLQLPPYTLATLDGLPGVRTEVPTTMDFSLCKTCEIREKAKLQLRADAYNLAKLRFSARREQRLGRRGDRAG